MNELEKTWDDLVSRLEKKFKQKLSLKGILYLIGMQELGMPEKMFTKEEKIDVLHVSVCRVLSYYGYYKFSHVDEDGWPHYEELKIISCLSEKEQKNLIKKGVINYLNKL